MTPDQGPDDRDPPMPVADDGAATLTPNRARQAVKLGTMRYVLAISTVGAAVVLVLAYFLIAH